MRRRRASGVCPPGTQIWPAVKWARPMMRLPTAKSLRNRRIVIAIQASGGFPADSFIPVTSLPYKAGGEAACAGLSCAMGRRLESLHAPAHVHLRPCRPACRRHCTADAPAPRPTTPGLGCGPGPYSQSGNASALQGLAFAKPARLRAASGDGAAYAEMAAQGA